MLHLLAILLRALALASGAAPFARDTPLACDPACTKAGNCNGETGTCDCPFGWTGNACNVRLMPACHTSHTVLSPPLYGLYSLKNCNCYRQLAKIGCPPVGDRECLYESLWNVSLTCFETSGPAEEQTSNIPPMAQGGFGAPGLTWYNGQPLLGAELMKRIDAPLDHRTPDGPYQLPLDACKDRCNERGICTTPTPRLTDAGTCKCAPGYKGDACESPDQSLCYLSCRGGAKAGLSDGVCVQGFCHCPPGRWGLGCTRDARYVSNVGWLPSAAAPRVYVYTLPFNLVHPKSNDIVPNVPHPIYEAEQAFLEDLLSSGWADEDSAGAGSSSSSSSSSSGGAARGDPGWLDAPVLTQNPWEANLFVVPTWSIYYSGNVVTPLRLFRHVMHYLRTAHTWWNETGGRNHIMWALNDRGGCEWHHLEPMLKHPILMVHFGQAARLPVVHPLRAHEEEGQKVFKRYVDHLIEETPFKGIVRYQPLDVFWETLPCYRPEKDVVMPPTLSTWVQPRIHEPYGPNHDAFNYDLQRPTTLFFAGGVRGHQPYYSQGVRQAITHMMGPEGSELFRNRADYLVVAAGATQDHMLRSKYCLAPSGWGWGQRLVEAIAAGCVPVIVQDHIYQYLWDVVPYEEFSIRVSRRNLHRLPSLLDAVTPAQLRQLQEGLARWHRAFVYHAHYPHGLATNYTLASLRRRLISLWSANYR